MGQKIRQIEPIILGKNICKIRVEHNITQEEMARKMQLKSLDISRGTYSKIEMGTRNVTTAELEAIKDILETTYEALFEHTSAESE